MSRPLRIEYEGAFYHVMNRGRGRQLIFPESDFYQAFLQGIDEAHRRFGLEVHAYCLMGNHYHLLVRTPRGNLSRAMRHVNGLYTQRYNRLKKTDGPLFRGRYKAILVDASSYLLQVSRYIHRNPVETTTPLVAAIKEYPWSSYPAYLSSKQRPDWLYVTSVYGELGSLRPGQYRQYVELGNDEETDAFYRRKSQLSILGGESFTERQMCYVKATGKEVFASSGSELSITTVIARVASYYGVKRVAIVTAERGAGKRNIPRAVAMTLCQDKAGAKLQAIADAFNVGHYSTVSQTIRRLKVLMEESGAVEKDLYVISQDLTP